MRPLTSDELKALRHQPDPVLIGCDETVPHFSRAALEFSAEQLNQFFEGRCVFYCSEETGSLHFRNQVGLGIFSILWNAHKFCEQFAGEAHPFVFRVVPIPQSGMAVGVTCTDRQPVDLSDMWPESGYRWALIAIGDNGPYAVAGKHNEGFLALGSVQLGEGEKRLAAVLLRQQKLFVDSADIFDLRVTNDPGWC